MSDKPKPPSKGLALWQWGLVCIVAGVVASQMMGMGAPADSSAAARGEALGRSVAALLFIVGGVALIITHFLRRKRQQ